MHLAQLLCHSGPTRLGLAGNRLRDRVTLVVAVLGGVGLSFMGFPWVFYEFSMSFMGFL